MATESDAAPAPRRRGRRPRRDDPATDARSAIVAAAAQEFAAHGYDKTSMRAIARRAAVDPALVHHYFADKAELFAESISAPVRPDLIVRSALSGPRDKAGENLIRAVLTAFEEKPTRDRAISVLHTALGHEFAATMLRQFLQREVLRRVAAQLGGDDAELRAALAATQLVGVMVARYGVRVEPLASTSVDELVRRVGPVVQWHLTGDLPASDDMTPVAENN